jgi:SAM-dependent methyltransferase
VQRDYASAYSDLYTRHWWWRAREAVIVERLRRLAPPGGFGAILDVGCGDGLFFDRLRAFGEPHGVESDPSLVTPAGHSRGPIHIAPFDDTFDTRIRFGLVLLLDVIEHLPDDVAALRRAHGLLAPGGKVVVTVPAFPLLWTAHDDINRHFRRYSRRTFAAAAGAAGLRVEHATYVFQWLFVVKLATVVKERMLGRRARVPTVPDSPINRLLYWLVRLEAATYGRMPLPFGNSLLAVTAS